MRKKKVVAHVYIDVPWYATLDEVQSYVETAVASWHGGMDPDMAMFDLKSEDVRVPRMHVKLRTDRRRRLIV